MFPYIPVLEIESLLLIKPFNFQINTKELLIYKYVFYIVFN